MSLLFFITFSPLPPLEIDWYYQAGAHMVYPEAWRGYEEAIPAAERHDYLTAYRKRLTGQLGQKELEKAAKAWSVWEGRTSKLVEPSVEKFAIPFARIENHYFVNKGFFPRDGFLLEKQQIDKIRHIPTVIVQGRFDMVCPMRSAYDLKQVFPEADLRVTLSGHSGFEALNIKELVDATNKFKKMYNMSHTRLHKIIHTYLPPQPLFCLFKKKSYCECKHCLMGNMCNNDMYSLSASPDLH